MDELCRRYQESFEESDLSDELTAHVEACTACQAFVERQERLRNLLPAWKAPEFSSDFELQVLSRLVDESRSRESVWYGLWERLQARISIPVPLGATAALVLIFSLMLNAVLLMRGPEPSEDGPQSQVIAVQLPTMQPGASEARQVLLPQDFLGAATFVLAPSIGPFSAHEGLVSPHPTKTAEDHSI